MDKLLEYRKYVRGRGITLIAIIIFCALYGIHILNPTYVDWLLKGGDLTQHYLGWKAYRNSEWTFPIGYMNMLTYPNAVSVIFTDSIPIFAVIFKVFSSILPDNFQYFGMWGLICFILQGLMASRIIRNFTDNDFLIVIISTLFMFTPAMIFRMYYHSALAGQWILLLAFEPIFCHKKYTSNFKTYRIYGIISVLAAFIHIYFVLMCGIIMAGKCFGDMIVEKKVKQSLGLIVWYIFWAGLVIGILGGFSSNTVSEASGLGVYSLNFNFLFNPQGWSCIYKDLAIRNGQHESFAYLGAGCLLLGVICVLFFSGNEHKKFIVKTHRYEMVTLLCTMISAFIVALSPTITMNDKIILELKVPQLIINIWSVFRGTGRIGWIILYGLMIVFCILAIKIFDKKSAMILLLGCIILQIYDIHYVIRDKNNNFNLIEHYETRLKSHDFWDIIADNDTINNLVYVPSSVSYDDMYTFTDWALDNHMTVNRFYLARQIKNEISDSILQDRLSNLRDSDVFIFSEKSKMQCLKYDLNYYSADGFIVGYTGTLNDKYLMHIGDEVLLTEIFGNNQYLNGGEDIDGVRYLYTEGISYGPYWNILKGEYGAEIEGENLRDAEVVIYSSKGARLHDFEIVNRNNNKINILLKLSEEIEDLEIVVSNHSSSVVKLNQISIRLEERKEENE